MSIALNIETIHDDVMFQSLRGEWNTMLQASRANTIFLTWEWIATWWDVYRGSALLYVMVARDNDGQLVGIAPFQLAASSFLGLNRRDTIRFIGDGGDVTPEYLDVIACPEHEQSVAETFSKQMLADPRVRVIDLRPIAAQSSMKACLLQVLSASPGLVRCAPDSQCPVLPLPESTETFLATRSQNYRKKFGEYERRSRRDLDATFRVCLTEDDRRRDMASLVKLHQQRWTGQSGAFRSDRYIEFHDRFSARLLERGWLRLFTVERRSTPVAVLYCFMYCGRYSFYQAGRDPDFGKYRMGLLIMHKAILEAIKEGATVFDFLRGTEPYKYRWAEFNITNCRLMYWRNLRAQMKGSLQDALRQLRLAR